MQQFYPYVGLNAGDAEVQADDLSVEDEGEPVAPLTSAGKMLSVLMALGELGLRSRGGIKIADIVSSTGLPRPTVHRLLSELKRAGFALQDDAGRYRMGQKVLLLSAQCLGGFDLRRVAHQHLQNFAQTTGHTVHLGVRDGDEVAYIDKTEPLHGVHIGSSIGERRPLWATALGKALLAQTADADVARLLKGKRLKLTPRTIVDPTVLVAELKKVRTSGFAIDNEESTMGVRCVAATIRDYSGIAIAAVSVSTLKSQVTLEKLDELGREVSSLAKRISQDMAGASPID